MTTTPKTHSQETYDVKGEHGQIGNAEEKSTLHTNHPDAQWFPDAGLGLFLHWGISSVNAMNISWPMIPGRPFQTVTTKSLFSLVELLIVIAILAIMMTLVTPSLKHAVYKASVAKCGLNFKNVGLANFLYADDNDDAYLMWHNWPLTDYRSNGRTSYNSPDKLGRGPVLRDMMLPYTSETKEGYIDTFLCPQVDDEELWPTTHNGNYRVPKYYTQDMPIIQYFNLYGFRGYPTIMRRIGDTWNWGNTPNGSAGENSWSRGPSDAIHYNYNLLAADRILKVGSWGRWTVTNHYPPNFVGEKYQRGYSAKAASAAFTYEANYLFDDGSVKFYKGIEHDPGADSEFLKWHRGGWVPVEAGTPQ